MIARTLFALALLVAPAHAERLEWHSAPAENLERIDIAQIATARQTIDFAAFVLTDWAIMDALRAAAQRGVGVRLLLDGSQFERNGRPQALKALFAEPNVLARVRPSTPDIMHLKAYAIDGRLLRTGSANFSPSGLKRQVNDLLLTDDRRLIDAFTRTFETTWDESATIRQENR